MLWYVLTTLVCGLYMNPTRKYKCNVHNNTIKFATLIKDLTKYTPSDQSRDCIRYYLITYKDRSTFSHYDFYLKYVEMRNYKLRLDKWINE